MPEFDDVTQPPHYRPTLDYNPVSVIDRYTVLLKDGETTATIYPIHLVNELPPGLLAFLCDEFNMEIERGDTFPFFDTLHIETFQNYWFGAFTAVMVLGDMPTLQGARQWEKECLGTFFIKPNYPGRCLHICTGGFLVNAGIRGKGIGRTLADCYLQWAPRLGYTYSIFNLVFESNVAARRIWESLNFKRIGRVKSAGILKGHDNAVDAIMYGRELVNNQDPAIGAYRFDKIKFYLETGRYPAMADRQEKLRLRSSASHYRLVEGRLMLKGREVVSDPVKQLQICTEVHMTNHGGINKTTAAITEKYHWTRIKDTVATAIKNCQECRDPAKDQQQQQQQQQPRHMQLPHGHTSTPHVVKRSADLPLNGNNKKLANNVGVVLHGNQPLGAHKEHDVGRDRNGAVTGVNHRLMRRTDHDDVEAMVAAAQLHNLPGRHDATDSMLSHDLSLDDGIIAAVEAAQRSQLQQQAQTHLAHLHLGLQVSPHPQPTYASVAASAVSQESAYAHFDSDYSHEDFGQPLHTNRKKSNNGSAGDASNSGDAEHRHDEDPDNIPVDPQVTGFGVPANVDERGEEIEIARALIHANEVDETVDSNDEDHKADHVRNRVGDDANIFFKEDQD